MLKIDKIIAEYQDRLENSQTAFAYMCKHTDLVFLLKKAPCWAIIGGAVRDIVFSYQVTLDVFKLKKNWIDLDICLPVNIENVIDINHLSITNKFHFKKNTFGGTKLFNKTLGYLDFWTWNGPEGGKCAITDWERRLRLVDFGINGIAFAYPQLEIVVSRRQLNDLRERKIEKLAKDLPKPHLQPLRALYLKSRFSNDLSEEFQLGDAIEDDLKWLLCESSDRILKDSLNYLRSKISTKRWHTDTVGELYSACVKYNCNKNVFREIESIQSHIKTGENP